MSFSRKRQEGFVLIIAMILLVVMSLLAVNGMGLATMGERMAGNYMDRARAQMTAEQALTQGQALLRANAVACMDVVCNDTNLVGVGAEVATSVVPNVWSNTNSVGITTAAGQLTTGRFLINALTHANFAKTDCRPYSILGLGSGLSADSTVLLQTIAYICPVD